MAEEFTVYELGGNGGAVYLYKRHLRTLGQLIDALGHQLLTGTVGAGDEHAGLRGSHLLDHILQMGDGAGSAHHLAAVNLLFEDFGFFNQGGFVCGVLQGDEDAVQVQRLLDEIESSLFDAIHGGGNIGMTGNHYHGRLYALFYYFGQHLGAVHFGHLDVAEYGVVFFLFGFLEAFLSVFGSFYLIAFHFQDFFQGVTDGPLVVYNQNLHR